MCVFEQREKNFARGFQSGSFKKSTDFFKRPIFQGDRKKVLIFPFSCVPEFFNIPYKYITPNKALLLYLIFHHVKTPCEENGLKPSANLFCLRILGISSS